MINNTAEQWIAAAEMIRKRDQDPFFRIGIQGILDNGNMLCAILHRDSKDVFQGGLHLTKNQLDQFKNLDLLEESLKGAN